MHQCLHILTRRPEPFVQTILDAQAGLVNRDVTIVDLTQPNPDYTALLEKVFTADSVAVW